MKPTNELPLVPSPNFRTRCWALCGAIVATGLMALAGGRWCDPQTLLDVAGYWIVGLLVASWALIGSRWLRQSGAELWRLLGWWGLAGAVAAWALLATREPGEFKLLMDEPLLMDTSLGMHIRRTASMPAYVCETAAGRSYLGSTMDKRPLLFPFALSLAHDLTGYRVENAFWLNRGLLLVLLALGWICGRKLDPKFGGPVMLLWFCGWPLLAQNASGGGFDLLNLALVLAVFWVGTAYLEERNENAEAFLLATCLLLANTRYESVLFLAVFAALWLGVAIRRKRIALSWFVAVSPLFLLPFFWQRAFMAQHAARWENDMRPFNVDHVFGADYIAGNLGRAWRFLAIPNRELAGSAFLGALGLAALVGLGVAMALRWRNVVAGTERAWLALGAVIAVVGANFGILMCYFWGWLDDPAASRLALPLIALMGLSLCVLRPILLPSRALSSVLLAGLALWLVGYAVPAMNEHRYSRENMHMRAFRWAQEVVAQQQCRRPLVISLEERVWTAYRTYSLLPESARRIMPQIDYQLREGSVDTVYVMQSFAGERDGTGYRMLGGNQLPPGVSLERVAECSFYPYNMVRLSRVTSIDLARCADSSAAGAGEPSGVFIRLTPEQMKEVRSLLP